MTTAAQLAAIAPAARREFEARLRGYPQLVADSKVTREFAEADALAWQEIDNWAAGRALSFALTWPELEHAAAIALQRREEAVARAPADAALIARRDAVAAIHGHLSRHRAMIDDLNAALRLQARRAREAA